jgi:hypothetical protein
MRSTKEIDNEIKKCRLVFKNIDFPQIVRDSAWSMMLTLQWVKTTHKTNGAVWDYYGIRLMQIHKLAKRREECKNSLETHVR